MRFDKEFFSHYLTSIYYIILFVNQFITFCKATLHEDNNKCTHLNKEECTGYTQYYKNDHYNIQNCLHTVALVIIDVLAIKACKWYTNIWCT